MARLGAGGAGEDKGEFPYSPMTKDYKLFPIPYSLFPVPLFPIP